MNLVIYIKSHFLFGKKQILFEITIAEKIHVITNHIHKDDMNLLKKNLHVTAQFVRVLVLVSGNKIC